jgi:hypothetical protein
MMSRRLPGFDRAPGNMPVKLRSEASWRTSRRGENIGPVCRRDANRGKCTLEGLQEFS